MKSLLNIVLIILFSLTNTSAENKNGHQKVKAVVQIVVDQLRGDILNKFKSNFCEDGFKLLMQKGLSFTNANFIHSITKTAPGHATIATGSIPALHGIVGNDWYDEKTDSQIYACEDKSAKVFGDGKRGLSPKNLVVSTLSDEIYLATEGKSKIFGVSFKDRGAIFLAGHSGKAFWFSKSFEGFTSSKYYFTGLPGYVVNFNNSNLLDKYYKEGWKLLFPKEKYRYANLDVNDYERTEGNLGKTFPHDFKKIKRKKFAKVLPFTPFGDAITYEFAKEVIKRNGIGKDSVVDYFSVSFSSTDYIGHRFSPNSLEYEDQIYRLDRTIAKFLKFLDSEIGLQNILIVFTADHGVAEAPEYLTEHNQTAKVLSTYKFIDMCNKFGKTHYFINFNLVKDLIPPYIYLNEKEITKAGLNICKVESDLRNLILKDEGVYNVLTGCWLEQNKVTGNLIDTRVLNSYYPGRSGQLYIINMPGWYMGYNATERENSATHGTPWNYDTYVPLIFMGPGIPSGQNARPCGPQDIAATIAFYLGIKAPSGSVGNVLTD